MVIVGLSRKSAEKKKLYVETEKGNFVEREVNNISPYLVSGKNVIVTKSMVPLTGVDSMEFGNREGPF